MRERNHRRLSYTKMQSKTPVYFVADSAYACVVLVGALTYFLVPSKKGKHEPQHGVKEVKQQRDEASRNEISEQISAMKWIPIRRAD